MSQARYGAAAPEPLRGWVVEGQQWQPVSRNPKVGTRRSRLGYRRDYVFAGSDLSSASRAGTKGRALLPRRAGFPSRRQLCLWVWDPVSCCLHVCCWVLPLPFLQAPVLSAGLWGSQGAGVSGEGCYSPRCKTPNKTTTEPTFQCKNKGFFIRARARTLSNTPGQLVREEGPTPYYEGFI